MKRMTLLLFSFVLVGLFTIFGICKPISDASVNVLSVSNDNKYVKSSYVNYIENIEKEVEEEKVFNKELEDKKDDIQLKELEVNSKKEDKDTKKEVIKKETVEETKPVVSPKQEVVVTPSPTPSPSPSPTPTPTVTTKSGKVTYYILNCSGCSGNLASGKKTTNSMYNGYRAIAAGYEYNFGTLIKISGTPLGTFTGIVLDRGGAIGETKKFTFDILVDDYNTAIRYGTSNITYQVIREGW